MSGVARQARSRLHQREDPFPSLVPEFRVMRASGSVQGFRPDGPVPRHPARRRTGLHLAAAIVGTVLILTRLVARISASAARHYGIGSRLEFLLIPRLRRWRRLRADGRHGDRRPAMSRARLKVAWTGGFAALSCSASSASSSQPSRRLWSRMFTSDPAVLDRRASIWSGRGWPGFSVRAWPLPLLRFAGARKGARSGARRHRCALWSPSSGGLWLASWDAPQWTMFVVVACRWSPTPFDRRLHLDHALGKIRFPQ